MLAPIGYSNDVIVLKDDDVKKITGKSTIDGKTHYLVWLKSLENIIDNGFWHPYDLLDCPKAIEQYYKSPRARRSGGSPFDRHFIMRIF